MRKKTIDPEAIDAAMDLLVEQGLAIRYKNADGEEIWAITEKGRRHITLRSVPKKDSPNGQPK